MKKGCFLTLILVIFLMPVVGFSQVCVVGETQGCFCSDGTTSTQSCKADGSGWEQCSGCTYYPFWCDPTTNVCWQDPQRNPFDGDPGLTQPDALRYCQEVVFGGYDDWRLPNIDELRTLIRGNPPTETGGECPITEGSPMADGSNEACMASTEFGGPGIGGCYWPPVLTGSCSKPDPGAQGHPLETCSATVASDNEAWVGSILFDNGGACFNHLNSYADVRCIRNVPSPLITCAEGAHEACVPGETKQCTCIGKTEPGAQVCVDDGSCFGPCECTGFTPSPPIQDVCDQCDQVNLTIKVPEKLTTEPKMLMAFFYSAEGWTFPPARPPDGGTDYNQVIDPDIDVDKPYEMTVPGCTYYRENCISGEYYLLVFLLMEERMPPLPIAGEYWWGMCQEPITLGSGQIEQIPMEVELVPIESSDADGDSIGDVKDNCPEVANPCQEDADGDGAGNACDSDCDSPGDFYQQGPFSVQVVNVPNTTAPVELDIYTPSEPCIYPVVIFQHGFTGSIKGYETIATHLASHGFVVVLPQMYPPGGGGGEPTPEEEAALGVQIISWIEANINSLIPVTADINLIGLSGHSRGGQIAYRMALQVTEKVKALAGVDPVDGLEMFGQTLAVSSPLCFDIPTYILGTGLGPIVVDDFLACAPEEIGPYHFYEANPYPSWLVVATTHGHADMIDEEDYTEFCPGGTDRDGMRSLTGGTLAAFFSGILQGNASALAVLSDTGSTPVPTVMEMKEMRAPCDDGNECTDDTCIGTTHVCTNVCSASANDDPCCEDSVCADVPLCAAQGVINLGDVFANCGDVGVKVPICLENTPIPGRSSGEVGGVQVDLCESIDDCLVCVGCEMTERTVLFDCVVNELGSEDAVGPSLYGCCRVIIFSKHPGGVINPGICNVLLVDYMIKDEAQCCNTCIDVIPTGIVVSDQYGYDMGAVVGDIGQVCAVVCGDVYPPESAPGANNCGDSKIDIFDILEEVSFALGSKAPDPCQAARADVPTGTPPNCIAKDGVVNILDVMVIIDAALNRQDCCSYVYGGKIY